MTGKATGSSESSSQASEERIEIDLKDPLFAAFLAWLLPGLGHWYQGRRHKAVLFFVCILGTFIYGLYLGEGRVVYASMRENDRRLPYLCQVGVGLPALPALIQAKRQTPIQVPIFADKNFMAPPKEVLPPGSPRTDDLDRLHKRLHRYWELGTVYTMIAGLLNILAIYDAWGGPAYSTPAKKEDDEKPDDGGEKEGKT
ncbi:MAG TPA: DUF6677 family protein [Pirellulales bacterium]|jgi:hypothetical protein|nr:DUF6677 family protein [Pirellulales bacterium]